MWLAATDEPNRPRRRPPASGTRTDSGATLPARPGRGARACPAGGVGAGGVRTAGPSGARALDARTRAARLVLGADPERRRAGASARRPLPLGAHRAVWRRPRRPRDRRAARMGQPLLLWRTVPAAPLSRDPVRRGRRVARGARTDRRCTCRGAGRGRHALGAARRRAAGRRRTRHAAVRSRRAGRRVLAARRIRPDLRRWRLVRQNDGIGVYRPHATRPISSRGSSRASKAC